MGVHDKITSTVFLPSILDDMVLKKKMKQSCLGLYFKNMGTTSSLTIGSLSSLMHIYAYRCNSPFHLRGWNRPGDEMGCYTRTYMYTDYTWICNILNVITNDNSTSDTCNCFAFIMNMNYKKLTPWSMNVLINL